MKKYLMLTAGLIVVLLLSISVIIDDASADVKGGSLFGMGQNNNGQIGTGTTDSPVTSPNQIGSDLGDIISVKAVPNNVYFLTAAGLLYGLGSNSNHQLALNNQSNYTTPILLGGTTSPIIDFYPSSNGGVMYLTDSGSALYRGRLAGFYSSIQTTMSLPFSTDLIEQVMFESTFGAILTTDGRLYVSGQLASSTYTGFTQIGSNMGPFVNIDTATFTLIAVGSSGKVYGTSTNQYGQLGDGTTTATSSIKQIFTSITTATQVFASDNKVLVLTSAGDYYGAGYSYNYEFGVQAQPQTTPILIPSVPNAVKVVPTQANIYMLDTAGALFGIGQAGGGQLGVYQSAASKTYIQIGSGLGVITDFAVSSQTCLFTTFDGKLFGCGANTYGQLGTGDTNKQWTPVQIGADLGFISFMAIIGDEETDDLQIKSVSPKNMNAVDYSTYFLAIPMISNVSIVSNNTSYGTVSQNMVSDVEPGTVISVSGSVLTVGTTTIYANEETDTDQYTYTFTGWSGIPANNQVNSSITVTANFTRTLNEYTISFVSSNPSYGSVSVNSITVDYGTSIIASGASITLGTDTVTAIPAADTAQYDYEFVSWSGIPAGGSITGDVQISAQFSESIRSYTITWSIGGVDTTETYQYGETPSHEDPAASEGYFFAGWNPPISTVTGPQTYTAVFKQIVTITIYFDAQTNGGTVSGSASKTVTSGQYFGELPTAQRTNYHFVGWFTEPEGGNRVTATTVVTEEQDTTLYAHFDITGFAKVMKSVSGLFPILLIAMLLMTYVGIFRGRF